jgi:hypothetical protein
MPHPIALGVRRPYADRFRDLGCDSYGGSLGFGPVGAITATLSSLALIVVSILGAIIIIPLSILAWLLHQKINSDIDTERPRVVQQAIGFFQTISNQNAQTRSRL